MQPLQGFFPFERTHTSQLLKHKAMINHAEKSK